jgi:hypothetical protein
MFGPSRMTYDVAASRHQDHLRHAARITELRQARQAALPQLNRPMQRRLTSLRLTSALTVLKAALHI